MVRDFMPLFDLMLGSNKEKLWRNSKLEFKELLFRKIEQRVQRLIPLYILTDFFFLSIECSCRTSSVTSLFPHGQYSSYSRQTVYYLSPQTIYPHQYICHLLYMKHFENK